MHEVDRNETRCRGVKEARAVSQPNVRSSSIVPPLDLTKVKPYEDHLKEKQAAKEAMKKEKEKKQTQPSKSVQMQTL